jgi:hypothetical protein
MPQERGLGKCAHDHLSSYGFPTRPAQPFSFCSQCGNPMIWACSHCQAPLPEDGDELMLAKFCRDCGKAYFAAESQPGDRN